jgi:hypothetical protein
MCRSSTKKWRHYGSDTLLYPKAAAKRDNRNNDDDEGLDDETRAERARIRAFFQQDDDEDEIGIGERAGAKTIICHLANVNQDRYEQWRDSMSDEYYYALVEDLSSEARQKVLMHFI